MPDDRRLGLALGLRAGFALCGTTRASAIPPRPSQCGRRPVRARRTPLADSRTRSTNTPLGLLDPDRAHAPLPRATAMPAMAPWPPRAARRPRPRPHPAAATARWLSWPSPARSPAGGGLGAAGPGTSVPRRDWHAPHPLPRPPRPSRGRRGPQSTRCWSPQSAAPPGPRQGAAARRQGSASVHLGA